MAIRKLKLVATGEHAGKRLDLVLGDWLPDALGRKVSKAKGRKLIMAGAVSVNGSRIRNAGAVLGTGTTVEAYVDPARLFDNSTSRDRKFEVAAERILYEDDDLIVIDKPAGLPVHPTVDPGRDSVFAAVRRFLEKRDGGDPYIGVHHRLDRDTSGIVLFTKSRRVNAAVSDAFSRHQVVKVYQALSVAVRSTKLQKEWTIRNTIGKVSTNTKRARFGAVHSGGEPAETSFRIVEHHRRAVWIEAIPKTGRTHQIRVHLSEYGLPILGDDLYGGEERASRLMLHASRLTFPHPITGREILVTSPLPDDFKRCVRSFRNT
jgi:23S rRNA pseudouridine1911/1915/1917 synthase